MRMIFESKQLNEGPGAGYTVSGTLTKVVVHKILLGNGLYAYRTN